MGGCGAMVSNCPFYVEALYDQEKMPKNAKFNMAPDFFSSFFWGGGTAFTQISIQTINQVWPGERPGEALTDPLGISF